MSHTTTVSVSIKDKVALREAAEKNKARFVEDENVTLYDGTKVKGTSVYIPGWKYPVVFTDDGTCHMDNFNGNWGNPKDFQRIKRDYSVRVCSRHYGAQGIPGVEQMEGDTTKVSWQFDDHAVVGSFPLNGDPVFDVVGCSGNKCRETTRGAINALGMALATIEKPEIAIQKEVLRESN